ncbi:conserved hypothetical protein [Leishmania infantum JPCM5]|uniref:Uncharacterized protein n=2 Tax=Leishmania infantum TaxID=5671 RepID=A4I9U9_LEIIN|nr:conserved hypothetical protein [Leishmania infantum JPCM5]CAC9537809.1 hypothetical_protein_-_conserved [Leishmania infantum]CAM71602.1 conserved hypothetical protein [Leishmania infantum JPCM5]SUZ45514.1 hypothetical_protein_-_conserved [Leishmania infantum]|eukprot:XP_001468518.1 conserved hypothetical protein [Leishmania infantum JPCM5]
MALLAKVCRDGVVSDAFTHEIKERFSAPMEVTVAPPAAALGPATAPAIVPQAITTALQTGAQWQATVAPQATLAGVSIISAAPAAAASAAYSTLARAGEPKQQQERRRLQVEQASEFLQTLLLCDSGYNNSEAPPVGNPASSQWTESVEEVKGLHAAVAAVAVSAASNLISFLKTSITANSQASDSEASSSSLFIDNRRKRSDKSLLLLAAQCLYVLSRHFQLTTSVVKEALDLMDALYVLLKNSLQNRVTPLSAFRDNVDTCCLNTLIWLCVFSIVNMVAVWKKLRSSTGELRLNELIQSSVAVSIEATVSALRGKLRESVQPPNTGAGGGLHGGALTDAHRGGGGERLLGGSGGSRAASSASAAVYTWQVLVDSYLSVLALAEGCLLRAKGSEQGYDKALDAFLGARMASLSSPHAAATPASVAVHRGKVTKRMVELAPVPRTLSIPLGLLYIAPYEMMSYLFDEMLPLLRHLSELEVATHRRYCEQLEELPRLPSFVRGGSAVNRGGSVAALEAYYGYQQRGAVQHSRPEETNGEEAWLLKVTRTGAAGEVVGEPFTSEMAHLLEALAICLQHLPPEVLNPDLDSDCAATFFIFKNFVKHMRQVFATQRSNASSAAVGTGGGDSSGAIGGFGAVWENYTLKLMTKFLEVMAMIGRNPQYTQRVVVLLTDAQTECGEMQWHSLVSQALECAGLNSGVIGASGAVGSDGGAASVTALAAAAQKSSGGSATSGAADGDDMYALLSTVPGVNGVPRALHRQFTRAYARKCQRHYIASFFLLLRQLFRHPTLQPIVSAHMNLALALAFLSAPQQSQVMLGSTLSLISALITNAADAQLVWSFLEQRRLLQQSSVCTQQHTHAGGGSASPAVYDRFTASSSASATGQREPAVHEEALSIIGHCQCECTQGTYDITIGFLNLATALFQHDQPSMAALPVYNTVTHFISHEILRGVLKRMFARPHERYTVMALASAALRQALLVRFRSSESARTAVLPFATIMAINKAPTDVVGEVLKLILDASDAPYELLSHHRAAVRQAMRLLITAIQAAREQKIELLLFDNRTTLNTDLAVRVLGMCSLHDTLMTKTTLQLLVLFPFDTANQAAHYWAGLTHKYAAVLDSFAQLLHPLNTAPVVVQAPPELAQLDFEPSELVPGWSAALLTETKSLLLDLLMQHADVTEPSLTAWMGGFYGEELSRRDRWGQPSVPAAAQAASAHGGAADGDGTAGEPRWWRTTLLTSVVEGACDCEVEHAHPALAVKYVKLLYLLRANRLYGSLVIRPFLESVCQTLFLRLQHYRASQCTPVALSKYAYVLKLLALEACYTYRTAPESLRLAQNTTITSIAVEVLLSLLHPFGSGSGALAGGGAAAPSDCEYTAMEDSGVRSLHEVDGYNSDTHASAPSKRDTDEGKERQWKGDVAVMSRDAAVDITSWLPQALQVLPTFPEKLPAVAGGLSHLVPAATDGVVQYDMTSLYSAIQAEQARANKPSMTMSELRDRLRPFIAANDCFFSYAAGVSFVEGWCQLVSVSCSVVKGLSVSRLRSFALCILRGLDATTRLTAAAQEQVAVRLCHCLSTVMAHLRQTVCASVALSLTVPQNAEAEAALYNQCSGDYPGVQGSGCAPLDAARATSYLHGRYERRTVPRVSAQPMTVTTVPAHGRGGEGEVIIGKRRPRDESRHVTRQHWSGQGGGTRGNASVGIGKPFATHAGELTNFFSAANRSQLAQALLQQRGAERSGAESASVAGEQSTTRASWSRSEVADATLLLEPLVRALVHWGTRIATIRAELYLSLLCLAETPGVNLDDVAVWRFQRALLDVVCTDICSSSGSSAGGRGESCRSESTVAVQRHNGLNGAAPANGSDSGAAALPLQAQQAVALLVALLQASAPIRDEFCNPDAGSGDGLGKWALRCATALLQSADHAVCNFFASNGAQVGALLWHLRSAFDVVSVISLSHSSQVLHSGLLHSCLSMRAWQYSTLVVLGYSQANPSFDGVPSRSLVEQNKEVLQHLLLGVVRWVNLLLSSLGDAATLLYDVQKFIRENRQLIDHVFIAPAAVSSTIAGSARLSASHLKLCAELSDCLRALSCSVLAVDCRSLVDGMALAELLSMLSSDDVWRRGPTELYGFADVDSGEGGLGGAAGGASVASPAAAGAAVPDRNDDNGREDVKGVLAKLAATTGTAAAHAVSAAERGRDVVALTVRNLAHLLLNTEYGQRSSEDVGVFIPYADSTPMLRHSAEKRQLVAKIVRHVAQSLVQTSTSEVREFRLECYLYALHAMVCLLHSFVLPMTPAGPSQKQSSYPTSLPEDFVRYLSELPLGEFADTLRQAQEAVYQLREFNTDYRGGLRASRVAANAWVIGASSAGPHTLSNSALVANASGAASTADQRATVSSTPSNAPSSPPATVHGGGGISDAFNMPSTPGLLPAADGRLGGRDIETGPQSSAAAELAPASSARHKSHSGGPLSSTAASHSGETGQDPNTTVAFDLDGSSSRPPHAQGQNDASARAGAASAASNTQAPLLPATADGAKLDPDVTLWELLPERGGAYESEWTRLYDSATAHDVRGTVVGGGMDSVGIHSAPLQWKDVLNVENEVRQVKIAIANALRATTGAMSIVRKHA